MRKLYALGVFVVLLALAAGRASADPKATFTAYKCLACDKIFMSFPGDKLDANDFKKESDQLRRVFQFKDRGKNLPPCRQFKYHIFEKKGESTSGISWLARGDTERLAVVRDGGALSGIKLTEWECVYCKKHFYSLNDENLNVRDWELQTSFLFNLKGQAIPKCTAPDVWGHIFFPKKTGSVKSYELATIVYDLYWVKN